MAGVPPCDLAGEGGVEHTKENGGLSPWGSPSALPPPSAGQSGLTSPDSSAHHAFRL